MNDKRYPTAVYVIGVDPGPTDSAVVVIDARTGGIRWAEYGANADVRAYVRRAAGMLPPTKQLLAVETVVYYGRNASVGRSVMDTAIEVGRIAEAWASAGGCPEAMLIDSMTIRATLTGRCRGIGKPQIRVALLDLYGGEEEAMGGTKCPKCRGRGWYGRGRPECPECAGSGWALPPGPLAEVTNDHLRSALAVAITAAKRDISMVPWVLGTDTTSSTTSSPRGSKVSEHPVRTCRACGERRPTSFCPICGGSLCRDCWRAPEHRCLRANREEARDR